MYDQNEGLLRKLKSGEVTDAGARHYFRERTFSRHRLLKFLTQRTIDAYHQFPCTTVGGPRSGTPCSFPFVYPDCHLAKKSVRCKNNDTSAPVVYNSCISSGEDNPWCYTRTFTNHSHILGQYGDCMKNCSSDARMDDDQYNMVSDHYDSLWDEGIYRFDEEASGHCHTFNPVNISYSGSRGQLYALLGK